MTVKILEDRTPEDRCSVCGSDKSVKYYFIDKEGNRKLLCNKCALTYNPVEESSKESYVVTMTDYRYANGAYIPVESEEMRKALIKEDIYIGTYPDIETATIFTYKKIETLFGYIDTNFPYKINIEVSIYPDKNQKMFYVSNKGQIQAIFKIERENTFIHRNMINSVYGTTGVEQSVSAENCYITNDISNGSVRIDYIYHDINKCVNSKLFKADAYALLCNINEYADIFTRFKDLRDRKKTKDTLTIVLTGTFPERDSYDPFNTSYIDAYVGEGDPSNNMLNYIKVYNGKYELGDEKFIKKIMDEIQSINIPIDNVYIIDKRLLPEEKEDKSSKEENKKGIQLKDLKSEDIDSIVEEAAEKLSEKVDEDNEYVADECYINDNNIDFIGPGTIHTSVEVSKGYNDETYNEDLLYELAEATNIYTRFRDIRVKYHGKNLILELTGVRPIKDKYDPDNTTIVKAYCIDAVRVRRKCVYETKYQIPADQLSDNSYNIIDDFFNFAYDNLNLSEYDNLYIIDKRLLPEEKEDKSSKEKKAISCEIKPSFASKVVKEYDGVVVSYDFGDNEGKTEYYKSLNELIANLKKYTNAFTKFIDKRYENLESDDEDFALLKIDYNSIYDKYSINVYINNIAKFMRILSKDNPEINDAFKEALDFCKNRKFFIVSGITISL